MTYAQEVKSELTLQELDDACSLNELSALLHISSQVVSNNDTNIIIFTTTNAAIARRVFKLLKKFYDCHMELVAKKRMKLSKGYIFTVKVLSNTETIRNFHGLSDKKNFIPCDDDEIRAYFKGAFLASGSVNDPRVSNYHLEINTTSLEVAEFLTSNLNKFYLNAKYTIKNNKYLVYIKKSESIGEFIRMIGAQNKGFDFEDARILRDLKNTTNRTTNCDIANAQKAITAGNNQLSMIEKVLDYYTESTFTDRLKNAIALRQLFPEDSLTELSFRSEEICGKKISKSALNHCFRDIKVLYEKIPE